MFQFGPFGGNKKTAQPVDPITSLTTIAKQVVDDPSILNQNLREVCQHLGTPLHDKADQLLGTMISAHSSRMLSTVWTVLLQRLRESQDTRAQLAVLRHFSQLVDRISIPQRANAFRAFAREVQAFCDKPELIADRAFGKSFTSVVRALGAHAEAELSEELLEKNWRAVTEWTRLDARRAAASNVVCLVAYTTRGLSFSGLLDKVDAMAADALVAGALLLDAGCLLAVDQAKRLRPDEPTQCGMILRYKELVCRRLSSIVTPFCDNPSADPSTSLQTSDMTMIPLLVSSFSKLRQFDPKWTPAEALGLLQGALYLIQHPKLKKVVVCPLLALVTSLPPLSVSSPQGGIALRVVEERCRDEDSMTRCEAFGALATLVASPDVELPIVVRLVEESLALHRMYMSERCNVTIRGIVGFFAAVFPRISDDPLGFRLVHALTRSHLDLANTVNKVPPVQLQLLSLLEQKVGYLTNGAVAFIFHCFYHGDTAVREKSIRVLLAMCHVTVIDPQQLLETVPRGLDFLEGSTSSREQQAQPAGIGGAVRFVRNVSTLVAYFTQTIATCGGNAKTIQTCCEAVQVLGAELRNTWAAEKSLEAAAGAAEATLLPSHSVGLLRLLFDAISSVVSLPLDVVTCVVRAAAECARGASPTDSFDIFFHKAAFNLVWNLLHRCCSAIDPIAAPKLHQEPSLYLSHAVLHPSLETLLRQASQSAMSSAERPQDTDFYKLVDDSVALLLALARWGRKSPVFVAHLRHQYRFLLVCLDILAATHPVAALQACHDFFVLMFCEGGNGVVSGSLTPSWVPSSLHLSEAVPALQRTKYVSASVSILNRSLAFDLVHVGQHVFSVMRLFIAADVAARDTICYRTIDEKLSLFRRMSDIARDKNYYNAVHGSIVAFPVLQTLLHLYESPHQQSIAEIMPRRQLCQEALDAMTNSELTIGEPHHSLFADCRQMLVSVMRAESADADDAPWWVQFVLDRNATPDAMEASRCVVSRGCEWADAARTLCSSKLCAVSEENLCEIVRMLVSWSLNDETNEEHDDIRTKTELRYFLLTLCVSHRLFTAPVQWRDLDAHLQSASVRLMDAYRSAQAASPRSVRCLVVLSAVDPQRGVPQLVHDVLSSRRAFDLAHDVASCFAHEFQPTDEDVPAAPSFPLLSALGLHTDQENRTVIDILDAVQWNWNGAPDEAEFWDFCFPHTSSLCSADGKQLLPLLHSLVFSSAVLPTRVVYSTWFWFQCLQIYPDLPAVAAAARALSEECDDGVHSTQQALQTGSETENAQKLFHALKPLFSHSSFSLSSCRILAAVVVEVSPCRMDVDVMASELRDVVHGRTFVHWVTSMLGSNRQSDDGTPSNHGGVLNAVASVASGAAPRSVLGVILGLPNRKVALQALNPQDADVSTLSEEEVRQYFTELAAVIQSSAHTQTLFAQFLGWLRRGTWKECATGCQRELVAIIIALTKACIRSDVTAVVEAPEALSPLFELLATVLEDVNPEQEVSLSLRYSAMFILVLVAPDRQLLWQSVLDQAPGAGAEWLPLQPQVVTILRLVMELPCEATVEDIARGVVSIFTRSAALSAGIQESILWMVTKCCSMSVWAVVLGGEVCAPTELACLNFLCNMSQTVGMSQHLAQELHARYTPLLLSFGSTKSDLDSDEQRVVFWLITSVLLHTVISEERHTKPKPHMALADALYLYVDYPLASMSQESVVRIRDKIDQYLFPTHAIMPVPHSERNWNLHTRGHLLPVGGRQSLSKSAAEKMFTSILHMYAHVVSNVFDNMQVMAPESVSDVFFSLSTLSAGNASLLKHSPALEGTIASSVLQRVYGWYRRCCASTLAAVDSKQHALNFRMGLFPESSTNLEFADTFCIASCANIICSLFVRGNELLPGAVDVSFIMEKMLCMDIVSHQAALTSVIVMSGTSTRKELSRIAPLCTQRLFRDLDVCCKGSLSVSFAVLQLLRSAFSIVAALPDDHSSMKVCEAVWNGIVVRGLGGRRVQHYAHFMLQSMVSMSSASHTQWCVLRALVSSSSASSDEEKRQQKAAAQLRAIAGNMSNNSFSSVTSSGAPLHATPPAATPKKSLTFAEEMRERLDRYLESDSKVRLKDPNDAYVVAVRQSSISSRLTPASFSGAPSVGYSSAPPSESHHAVSEAPDNFRAGADDDAVVKRSEWMLWTGRLFRLSTTAAVILRSKQDEDQVDHNRVQVIDLLSQVEEALSAAGRVHLFVVRELLQEVLDANDAMFVMLNRFNFTESSLVLFTEEGRRVVSMCHKQHPDDEKLASMAVLSQLTLFVETALRRQESLRNCWWTATTLLCMFASMWSGSVFLPLVVALAHRLPSHSLTTICKCVCSSPQLTLHKKDVRMLLKTVESTAKKSVSSEGEDISKMTGLVVHEVYTWL